MKTIVSRLSDLHPEEQAFALGATACVSKDGSLHGVARGYPSQGDAKHRPETHRWRDAPEDEVQA
jgi:hypothetical protein